MERFFNRGVSPLILSDDMECEKIAKENIKIV
jgi:hypothetical protein